MFSIKGTIPKFLVIILVLVLLGLFSFSVYYSVKNEKPFLIMGNKFGFDTDKSKLDIENLNKQIGELKIKHRLELEENLSSLEKERQSFKAQIKELEYKLMNKSQQVNDLKKRVRSFEEDEMERNKKYVREETILRNQPWSDSRSGIKLIEIERFSSFEGNPTNVVTLILPEYGKITREIKEGDKWKYFYKGFEYDLLVVELDNEDFSIRVKVEKI